MKTRSSSVQDCNTKLESLGAHKMPILFPQSSNLEHQNSEVIHIANVDGLVPASPLPTPLLLLQWYMATDYWQELFIRKLYRSADWLAYTTRDIIKSQNLEEWRSVAIFQGQDHWPETLYVVLATLHWTWSLPATRDEIGDPREQNMRLLFRPVMLPLRKKFDRTCKNNKRLNVSTKSLQHDGQANPLEILS